MKKLAWTLVGLLLASGAFAEEIGLRNGQKIEGEVVRRTTGDITVRTSSGIATYQLIELDDATLQRFLGTVTHPAGPVEQEPEKPKDPEALLGQFVVEAGILWTLAQIVGFVAWVWWIVAGFRSSVWWGIALLLFQPCANLFLVIFQWDNAKVPFFLSLGTFALLAIPLVRVLF